MKPKKGKKVAKSQFIPLVLTAIIMSALGAVTSFGVTKSIALAGVTPPTKAVTSPLQNQKNTITHSQTIASAVNPISPSQSTAVIPVGSNYSTTNPVEVSKLGMQSTSAPVATSPGSTTTQKVSSAESTATSNVTHEAPINEVLAKITEIKPQYTTQTIPYRTCRWVERPYFVHYHRAMDGSGVFLGGVTGGLVGNQFGRGRGNIAATIGGSILGALVGNQMETEMNRPEVHYVPVKICKRHYEKKSILQGYNVTYSYNGKQETKFMKKKPQSDYVKLVLTPAVES